MTIDLQKVSGRMETLHNQFCESVTKDGREAARQILSDEVSKYSSDELKAIRETMNDRVKQSQKRLPFTLGPTGSGDAFRIIEGDTPRGVEIQRPDCITYIEYKPGQKK